MVMFQESEGRRPQAALEIFGVMFSLQAATVFHTGVCVWVLMCDLCMPASLFWQYIQVRWWLWLQPLKVNEQECLSMICGKLRILKTQPATCIHQDTCQLFHNPPEVPLSFHTSCRSSCLQSTDHRKSTHDFPMRNSETRKHSNKARGIWETAVRNPYQPVLRDHFNAWCYVVGYWLVT